MKILLSGGGTGGHITPLLTIAHELKQLHPGITIIYIGERGGGFGSLITDSSDIDASYAIFAGKYRRYHGESLMEKVLDIRTIALNLRDVFFAIFGILQSLFLLLRLQPSVVFLKGGFVGAPVGLAAAVLRVPFITHDSDTVPGLANRIVGRWAAVRATGLSKPLNGNKSTHAGVIINPLYVPVSASMQTKYRGMIGIPENAKLMLVTGGSSGSESINKIIAATRDDLLSSYDDLYIIHQTGKGKQFQDGLADKRYITAELLSDMYRYSAAADVIISRAGANTIAELAAQKKPVIFIPAPHLSGGHQLKNAQLVAENQAGLVIDEAELLQYPDKFLDNVKRLLNSKKQRNDVADQLYTAFGKKSQLASRKIAKLLIEYAQHNSHKNKAYKN
jgi:UDP-N-acetylglucosamine--N-acetylmuramyl-(pentapeptide) pyrophosphoryl-undecaprenol N-acetylglucosamine transferase